MPPILRHYNELRIWARNKGRVYAQYVNCWVQVPECFIQEFRFGSKLRRSPTSWYFENIHEDKKYRGPYAGSETTSSRYEPILPSLATSWRRGLPETLDVKMLNSDETITWVAYADNAPRRTGTISLREIKLIPTGESEEETS